MVFNNGHYQSIDLSHRPPEILPTFATDLSQADSVFEKFSRKDAFLTK
jgi:hypothetical protein